MRLTSKTKKDTSKIAKIFLHRILSSKTKKALVVGLKGELGTGKTTFTQAIGKLLGVKGHINSPTFVIMKKYPIKKEQYKYFFHLDAYRLRNEKELLYLGWQKIIGDNKHLVFIEWPENVAKVIPRNSHFISISHGGEGRRTFKIKNRRKT